MKKRWERQSRAFYNVFRQADRVEKLAEIIERLVLYLTLLFYYVVTFRNNMYQAANRFFHVHYLPISFFSYSLLCRKCYQMLVPWQPNPCLMTFLGLFCHSSSSILSGRILEKGYSCLLENVFTGTRWSKTKSESPGNRESIQTSCSCSKDSWKCESILLFLLL